MILVRKVLNNPATRYKESNGFDEPRTFCGSSSSRQRHVLATTLTKYTPSATKSHTAEARLALVQSM